MRNVVWKVLIGGTLPALFAGPAMAHPHVFVGTSMEIVGDGAGQLSTLRTTWKMDELFSSAVFFDYDADRSGKLDDDELANVASTIIDSAKEFSYFTFLEAGQQPVAMNPPASMQARYENGQVVLSLEMQPAAPVSLTDEPVTISTYDSSYYVSFEVAGEDSYAITGAPAPCRKRLIEEEPNDTASSWMDSVAALGPDENIPADGVNFAMLLAPKLQVDCG